MSKLELADHVSELKTVIGAQLQEIEAHPKGVAFSLYKKGRIWWLLDLTPQSPMSVLLYEETPWKKKITPKPAVLFLNSHAKNLMLSSIEILEQWGRVLLLRFSSSQKSVEIEVHLIPKAVNLIVRTGDKSIAWSKPKPLVAPPSVQESHRDIATIKMEWLDEQKGRVLQQKTSSEATSLSKVLEKKKKALEQILLNLDNDEASILYKKGEDLKSVGNSEMGIYFEKAKALLKKREGTLQRVELLRKEIEDLSSRVARGETAQFQVGKPERQLLKEAQATGRTLRIDGLIAAKGKSAQDNLSLLRAAKAWDLWVHLRDYPSSHLILSLDKGQKVSDEILKKAALWLAESSVKSKVNISGTRLDVVVTECRFVRPIKGDKLGRVHYQNERVFTVILP